MAKTNLKLHKRIQFKATHPNYGSDNTFDSWMTACECTIEIAQEKARNQLEAQFKELASQIADDMIETIEEYEP